MKVMLIDDDIPMLEYVGRLLAESKLGLMLVASASASERWSCSDSRSPISS